VQQQALRVYQKVALLSLDLLSGIVARRVDFGPPFSALLTLWLSMIAAVCRCRLNSPQKWRLKIPQFEDPARA
jgi:hypothetical protein